MAHKKIAHAEELSNDADALRKSIVDHLHFNIGKDRYSSTKRDLFHAICFTVRDRLTDRWMRTQRSYYEKDEKRVYYLSMEFLIGRTLRNSLVNLGILDNCKKAVHDLGFDIEALFEMESDAGLGNGGLGRLAACFLDSMATLQIPGYGYGIRYDYGIFTQAIQNGQQVERPDNWLRYGNPWELCRSEYLHPVQFYGKTKTRTDSQGKIHVDWIDTSEVVALPYDMPVPGYGNQTVNTLRLWQAKSSRGFDLNYFNHGNYIRAVEDIALTENITRVLYPNDNVFEGQELRLKQEYFLVAATIQDILRRYNKAHVHLDGLPDKVAIQLNDTHPALAVPELMRLLIDREELSWEKAWQLTQDTLSYTNHTLLPEALERWPVSLIGKVLPRHLEIIYEINQRWLNAVAPTDEMKQKLSIIEGDKVNMARLAIVGTHKVNGVSQLHSDLLKHQTFRDFSQLMPQKFTNKTNGITPRRWLKECNPALSSAITDLIGNQWVTNLDDLVKLAAHADDSNFQEEFLRIKRDNKETLSREIFAEYDVSINLDSLFDCQAKRIHEYKRQLLNALHVIHLYLEIKRNPRGHWTPRTVIFSGKAAPGYMMAKLIIQLIVGIGTQINNDPEVSDLLKVFFLSNYRVSLAETLIPAADLSEQISLAGTEASGTGNMKFALNGALTIGTLDGANIEICQAVGEKNIYIFGLKAQEVEELKKHYNPRSYYEKNLQIKEVIDLIGSGLFGRDFQPIIDSLLNEDRYCLLADFDSYLSAQKQISQDFQNRSDWAKRAILNVAHMGRFSSDRTIRDYAEEIWKL